MNKTEGNIENIDNVSGVYVEVNDDQALGTYALAGNAFGFRGEISLYVGDGNDTHKKLSIGGSADYSDKRYELQMQSGELALKISAL